MHPGFPIAEIDADGSSVITKHPGTGGLVSVDTVTAQLLYEIGGARYANPDVTLRVDSLSLERRRPRPGAHQRRPRRGAAADAQGVAERHRRLPQRDDVRADRSGHRGQGRPGAAPAGGRADGAARRAGVDAGAHRPSRRRHRGGGERTAALRGPRLRPDRSSDASSPRPQSNWPWPAIRGSPPRHRPATVRCTACSPPATSTPPRCRTSRCTPTAAARRFPPPRRPGCSSPSTRPRCRHRCQPARPGGYRSARSPARAAATRAATPTSACGCAPTTQWRWLAHTLTVDALRELLPETADLPVTRHLLPNLRAVNFVIEGILGKGVAHQARFDPQAKGLGEWLRSRHVDIPEALLS